jgi:hypothetical protein
VTPHERSEAGGDDGECPWFRNARLYRIAERVGNREALSFRLPADCTAPIVSNGRLHGRRRRPHGEGDLADACERIWSDVGEEVETRSVERKRAIPGCRAETAGPRGTGKQGLVRRRQNRLIAESNRCREARVRFGRGTTLLIPDEGKRRCIYG